MAIKIIGHRGAAGLALENSAESIAAAMQYHLDGIEFDVRRTLDGKLVVIHDKNTRRIAQEQRDVNQTTLADLQSLHLKNGQAIATLEEVLQLIDSRLPVVIDIKDSGIAAELLRILALHPKLQVLLTGRKYIELAAIHRQRPELLFLVQHHFDPIEIIHTAKSMHASGISLNMWLMNPLTYHLAKRHKLEVYVYTINHPWIIQFFRWLYPDVAVFTNCPHRFTKLAVQHKATAKR